MSQTRNGEADSGLQSAGTRLKQIDEVLDSYERELSLHLLEKPKEVDEYLALDRQTLEKMRPEDCGVAAHILSQYSGSVGRAYNRELTRYRWADSNIKLESAAHLNEFTYCGFEEKVIRSTIDNAFLGKLYKIREYANGRATRLYGLAQQIRFMAETLIELQRTKRGKSL